MKEWKDVNRIYVDAYKTFGLGHLIRTRTIAKEFGEYKESINNFLAKKADKKLRLTIWMKGMWEMRMWMNHKDWKWNMMW